MIHFKHLLTNLFSGLNRVDDLESYICSHNPKSHTEIEELSRHYLYKSDYRGIGS